MGLYAYTFTDNFTAKYMENLAHAYAVDTRPSLRIIEGLGTRLQGTNKLSRKKNVAKKTNLAAVFDSRTIVVGYYYYLSLFRPHLLNLRLLLCEGMVNWSFGGGTCTAKLLPTTGTLYGMLSACYHCHELEGCGALSLHQVTLLPLLDVAHITVRRTLVPQGQRCWTVLLFNLYL